MDVYAAFKKPKCTASWLHALDNTWKYVDKIVCVITNQGSSNPNCLTIVPPPLDKTLHLVVVVVVDFIYSRWSNRQSLLKGTYWRKKKRRKGQKIEIWEGRINWLNHYGMNYNTELENYIQLLMSPTVNEMNLG